MDAQQTPDAITAILHAKAEKQLINEVDAAFEPARRMLKECNCINIDGYVLGQTSRVTVKFNYYEALSALKQAAIDYHLPNRKLVAVESFLNKVDQLQAELDDLRGSVQ